MTATKLLYLMCGVAIGMAAFVGLGLVTITSLGDTQAPLDKNCPAGYVAYFRPGKLNVITHWTTDGRFICFREQDGWPPNVARP
jgi:hypothetical protein